MVFCYYHAIHQTGRFQMVVFKVLLLLSSFLSSYAFASIPPCQTVAQIVGSDEYQAQPLRMASLLPPSEMPAKFNATHIETHGAWSVYQSEESWMVNGQCAPVKKFYAGKAYEFVPVILNKQSGHNAVISGSFIIKVYRREHLDRVLNRYALKTLSPVPNPESLIVDAKPQDSYDEFIKKIDLDKDVRFALPILIEPLWSK